jgi:hypothetical protein
VAGFVHRIGEVDGVGPHLSFSHCIIRLNNDIPNLRLLLLNKQFLLSDSRLRCVYYENK